MAHPFVFLLYPEAENCITGAAGYTYTYDADGNRVEKSNGSTGTIYWYMSPGIVAESDLSGNLKSEYVFFDGERIARKDFPGNAVSYYFSDHLETASVITNSAGVVTEDEDYYPWGGELQFVNSDSNHYKFTGKERDSETGLDYFGARYYGNWVGRFLAPDWAGHPTEVPYANFGNPQSLNLYTYGKNNPTTFGDPDGHCPPCPVEEETGYAIAEEEAIGTETAATGTLATEAATGTGLGATAAGGGPTLGLLAGPVLVFGTAMAFPSSVGQSDADERAAMEQASRERAAQNGGVDPVTQPAPQAQNDVEAKRKSSRTLRREWQKAKGKKWPRDKNGNNYDADHMKALADGGSNNAARNIQPLTRRDHVRRHKKSGDFRRWAKRRKRKS